MNWKNIIIALLVVFALGGYVNQQEDHRRSRERPLARLVNNIAEFGLKYFFWQKIQEPLTVNAVNPGEIDHRSAL